MNDCGCGWVGTWDHAAMLGRIAGAARAARGDG